MNATVMTTGPGQVFTWDITKLAGPARGLYYDAYVMIDIYSRYIVGWKVAATESAELAEGFIADVFAVHGVPQVVHADRGTSMTSKKVADLLADLHVQRHLVGRIRQRAHDPLHLLQQLGIEPEHGSWSTGEAWFVRCRLRICPGRRCSRSRRSTGVV